MPEEMAKGKEHYLNELREMISAQRRQGQPIEKVFAIFCHRHGIPLEECRRYYDRLVAEGLVQP